GGNDIINGGAGADIMYGGAGNDTFIVDNSHDQAIENPGEGSNDTVQSSVNFTLGDNIEQLYLTGTGNTHGTGNAGDNFISGNSGNNVIEGLGGADSMDGGAGIDTVTFASSSSAVNVSLETGIGHGGDAEGDTFFNFENVTG